MNKTEALKEVKEAVIIMSRTGLCSNSTIAEAERVWREAVYCAIAVGATEKEIGEAEREGQS